MFLQCSLVICSFIVRGTVTERFYRELRGTPVKRHTFFIDLSNLQPRPHPLVSFGDTDAYPSAPWHT